MRVQRHRLKSRKRSERRPRRRKLRTQSRAYEITGSGVSVIDELRYLPHPSYVKSVIPGSDDTHSGESCWPVNTSMRPPQYSNQRSLVAESMGDLHGSTDVWGVSNGRVSSSLRESFDTSRDFSDGMRHNDPIWQGHGVPSYTQDPRTTYCADEGLALVDCLPIYRMPGEIDAMRSEYDQGLLDDPFERATAHMFGSLDPLIATPGNDQHNNVHAGRGEERPPGAYLE